MDKFDQKNLLVSVTVATETEPTTVDGVYSKTEDGFTLEFGIGTDKFVIAHSDKQTTVKAEGVMEYDITLKGERTFTMLSTPFGKVKFCVTTEARRAAFTENSIRLQLCYMLSADGVGDMERSVDLLIKN
ncbi:MAG: DUF1934 domain-containing protein [Clostridiales bacterium]|nr:DUF1934 domain-containing protein [Clostridiales bacterium]